MADSDTKQTTENGLTPAGGASRAIDLTNERDRGLVRQAMKNWPKRWRGLTDEFKDALVNDLKTAREEASEIDDPEKRVSARVSIAKTAAMMEGQNQSDDHLLHKTTEDGEDKSVIRVVFEDRLSKGKQ